MAYRVRLTPRAAGDADAIYRRVTAEAPFAGHRWYRKLIGTLQSLDTFPERGQIVEKLSRSKYLVRRILFGRKTNVLGSTTASKARPCEFCTSATARAANPESESGDYASTST